MGWFLLWYIQIEGTKLSDYFTHQHFDLLKKYNNQARDKNDLEQNHAYVSLKEANDLTKKWGEAVQKILFPNGSLGHFINRPTNQANNFKPYTWAKIYPRTKAPKQLAYTVGIDAYSGFIVKIDTVGDVGDKRVKYEKLRGEDESSDIVSTLSIEDGLSKSLEELIEWGVKEIQQFGLAYDDLCIELALDDEQDISQLTVKKVLNNSATVNVAYKERGSNKLNKNLNRILFGAAGTGKTYHTINHALAILEDKTIAEIEKEEKQENGRKILKDRFDQFKKEGQIKFVTFHQSFSYEDFVEGIRAETDEGILTYDVKSGVFKEICERAKFQKFAEIDIDKIVDDFVEEISKNEKILETKTGVEFTVFNSSGKGGISVRTTTQNEIVISKKAIKAYLLEPSENIRRNQAYAWAVARYLQLKLDEVTPVSKSNSLSYVIIIDEINRGNISRIFGELITLIEDSKREGAEEALSVTLPYSKEEFSVPENVYIIGTMNSSDRSLTGLDIALRRRFTFIEMPPKPELLNGVIVEGLDIEELLKVINQRIEVLLDRDHCIGHANFMSLKEQATRDNLAHIFKHKIIPQLQEYFFDDWGKINLVLFQNDMITEDKEINISSLFPADAQLDTDYSERKKVWRINDDAFKTIDAFKKILG